MVGATKQQMFGYHYSDQMAFALVMTLMNFLQVSQSSLLISRQLMEMEEWMMSFVVMALVGVRWLDQMVLCERCYYYHW